MIQRHMILIASTLVLAACNSGPSGPGSVTASIASGPMASAGIAEI